MSEKMTVPQNPIVLFTELAFAVLILWYGSHVMAALATVS